MAIRQHTKEIGHALVRMDCIIPFQPHPILTGINVCCEPYQLHSRSTALSHESRRWNFFAPMTRLMC